jgi:N-methylhydantoinase A/oxoprolinase/acetone carboxylase beta subunit
MVEAVAMRTFGLGGDSEVALHERSLIPTILLGPRRLVPLSLAAVKHREIIEKHLGRQLLSPTTSRLDGRFAMKTGVPKRLESGLSHTEARLYAEITAVPAPLDRLLISNAQVATLNRLVGRGLVHIIGFTPSDAAHALGRQANWDASAARLGAELFSRRRDGQGRLIADDADAFSEMVLAAVTRHSAEVMLETVFSEDGLEGAASVANPLVQRAVSLRDGMARLSIMLDRPVIGLGASAHLHYAGLPRLLGNECVIAEHADVANALGAVVGQVRMSSEARISQPEPGLFRLNAGERLDDFETEEEAMLAAEAHIRAAAEALAERAGTDQARIEITRDIRVATIQDERTFVEAFVVATATGRPRVAS